MHNASNERVGRAAPAEAPQATDKYQEESEMSNAAQYLHGRLDMLEKTVEHLTHRLAPILKTGTIKDTASGPRVLAASSPLACAIHNVADNIRAIEERLSELVSRVAL